MTELHLKQLDKWLDACDAIVVDRQQLVDLLLIGFHYAIGRPGITPKIVAEALHDNTAHLPLPDRADIIAAIGKAIATNTAGMTDDIALWRTVADRLLETGEGE